MKTQPSSLLQMIRTHRLSEWCLDEEELVVVPLYQVEEWFGKTNENKTDHWLPTDEKLAKRTLEIIATLLVALFFFFKPLLQHEAPY